MPAKPTTPIKKKPVGGEAVKKVVPAKRGAPTKKNDEIIERILVGISQGKSSRAMCAECGISQPSLWKWLAEDENFSKQYAHAKQACADLYAEETIEIADEEVTMIKRSKHHPGSDEDDGEVEVVFDPTAVQRNRLRVDARKWYASKLAPKKYGDRTTLAGDAENPLIPPSQVHSLTTEQLIAIASGKTA